MEIIFCTIMALLHLYCGAPPFSPGFSDFMTSGKACPKSQSNVEASHIETQQPHFLFLFFIYLFFYFFTFFESGWRKWEGLRLTL